jgi:hypothetical protein
MDGRHTARQGKKPRRDEKAPYSDGEAADLPLRGFDNLNAATAAVELDESVDQGIKRKVGTLTNPLAGVEFVPNLADENIPGTHRFSAESLHAATLRVRVTSISAGALSFFVCHEITSPHGAIRSLVSQTKAKLIVGYGFTSQKQPAGHGRLVDIHRATRRMTVGCESLFLAANPTVVNPCGNPFFTDRPTRSRRLFREPRSESLLRARNTSRLAARS